MAFSFYVYVGGASVPPSLPRPDAMKSLKSSLRGGEYDRGGKLGSPVNDIIGLLDCAVDYSSLCYADKPTVAKLPLFTSSEGPLSSSTSTPYPTCSNTSSILMTYNSTVSVTFQCDPSVTGLPALNATFSCPSCYSFTIDHNCACPGANATTCASAYPQPGTDYGTKASNYLNDIDAYQNSVAGLATFLIWIVEAVASYRRRHNHARAAASCLGKYWWVKGFFISPANLLYDDKSRLLLAPLLTAISTTLISGILFGASLSSLFVDEVLEVSSIIISNYPLFIANYSSAKAFGSVIGCLLATALAAGKILVMVYAFQANILLGFSSFPAVIATLVVAVFYGWKTVAVFRGHFREESVTQGFDRSPYVKALLWRITSKGMLFESNG